MPRTIETKLLEALEIFHYAYRFRSAAFVVVVEPGISFNSILTDLRLLLLSRIDVTLVTEENPETEKASVTLTRRGLPFLYRTHRCGESLDQICNTHIRTAFANDSIPLVAFRNCQHDFLSPNSFYSEAVRLAAQLNADKLFIISKTRGLELDHKFCSHISSPELLKHLNAQTQFNIPPHEIQFWLQQKIENSFEIVLLDSSPGALFQEIFTHHGYGTLLTDNYQNSIRRAKLKDVTEIYRLIEPHIRSGAILGVTEDNIAEQIDSYYTYTINNTVVAAVQLVDYGIANALSKFTTLPRYQGRGRAKQLARKLIKISQKQKKEYVFALSIEPKMWDFFQSLGFAEVPRESLPQSWKENYDFSRPSKAFAWRL